MEKDNHILKIYYQSETLSSKIVYIPLYSLSTEEVKVLLSHAKTLTVSLENLSGITHRQGDNIPTRYSQIFSKVPNVIKLEYSSVNGVLHNITDKSLLRIISKIIETNPPEEVFTDNIISEYMKNVDITDDITLLVLRTRDGKIKIPNKKCVELYYA